MFDQLDKLGIGIVVFEPCVCVGCGIDIKYLDVFDLIKELDHLIQNMSAQINFWNVIRIIMSLITLIIKLKDWKKKY